MKNREQSYGKIRTTKDGKEEFVRPPRYLWLVKYNEEKNEFSFDNYGPFIYTEGDDYYGEYGEKYKFYESKIAFFMDDCVCAYCVAENERTALDRVFNLILQPIREKNRFMGQFASIRAQNAKGLDGVFEQDIFGEKDGKPLLPFPYNMMKNEIKQGDKE